MLAAVEHLQRGDAGIRPVTRFVIDPVRSHVVIDARSSIHLIRSRATGLSGWLDLHLDASGRVDHGRPTEAHLELPVTQLRSGTPLEQRELRRRIDARRYPSITGDLRSMVPIGHDGRHRVRGDITFRGVTREMEDEMVVSTADLGGLRLQGSSVFDIRDFGMDPPRILVLSVQPEVTVAVDLFATPEG